jgi:succinoglycan biosynthesis transport protein ExoP
MFSPQEDRNATSLVDSGQLLALLSLLQPKPETDDVLPLDHYFWLLKRHLWTIVATVVFSTALTAIFCFYVTPVYEATASIAIDHQLPSTAIGQDSAPTETGNLDDLLNTEVRIIQSDPVLRPVAEQYHLLGQKKSDSFFWQKWTDSLFNEKKTDSSLGQKKIDSGNPVRGADGPVELPGLTVARIPNSLIINIVYRSEDRNKAANIANAIANSYITRGMEMRARASMGSSAFMEKQIGELKKNMDDSAKALAGYERDLGLINPDEKTSILTARILQLNTQYTDAQNDRVRKETDYQALKSGDSAALEVSPEAGPLAKLYEQLHAAQEKMAVVKTVYGPNYAEYKRAANDLAEVERQYQQTRTEVAKRVQVDYQEARKREAMLQQSLAEAKSESDQLNATSLKNQQLKQEAEANKTLYNELFRKIKEAGINAGFQSGTIRIADEARPQLHPVFPKKGLFIFLGFVLSLLASIAFVILSDILNKTLRDPDQARRAIGAEVVGTLPSVRRFPVHSRMLPGVKSHRRANMRINWAQTPEFYEECIHTLLSSLLLDRSARKLKSIVITSAEPGEGKSTCAAHMAAASASRGKRTLLIDADLRFPTQHRLFNIAAKESLTSAIAQGHSLRQIRQPVGHTDKLDVIVAGSASEHMCAQVAVIVSELLAEAALEYDLIIVDAPPMLFLSEPIQMACIVDGVLVIGRAGRTDQRAVAAVFAALRRVQANILGLVINRADPHLSSSYRHRNSAGKYAVGIPGLQPGLRRG